MEVPEKCARSQVANANGKVGCYQQTDFQKQDIYTIILTYNKLPESIMNLNYDKFKHLYLTIFETSPFYTNVVKFC